MEGDGQSGVMELEEQRKEQQLVDTVIDEAHKEGEEGDEDCKAEDAASSINSSITCVENEEDAGGSEQEEGEDMGVKMQFDKAAPSQATGPNGGTMIMETAKEVEKGPSDGMHKDTKGMADSNQEIEEQEVIMGTTEVDRSQGDGDGACHRCIEDQLGGNVGDNADKDDMIAEPECKIEEGEEDKANQQCTRNDGQDGDEGCEEDEEEEKEEGEDYDNEEEEDLDSEEKDYYDHEEGDDEGVDNEDADEDDNESAVDSQQESIVTVPPVHDDDHPEGIELEGHDRRTNDGNSKDLPGSQREKAA